MTELRKWARLSVEQKVTFIDTCQQLYRDGSSIREVAEHTGRAYGSVHAALVAAGVTLRPRGNPGRRG